MGRQVSVRFKGEHRLARLTGRLKRTFQTGGKNAEVVRSEARKESTARGEEEEDDH